MQKLVLRARLSTAHREPRVFASAVTPRRLMTNCVLTNAPKNGGKSRHDGAVERPGKLGTVGLRATRRYDTR